MKVLYLDTEFTDLIPDNKLISIALVDENEEYFYAELTDTYELSDCSDFVKEHVLPYLHGGEYKMSFNECALKLRHWIEERNVDCILGMDNPSWDKPHLVKLMGELWPENLRKNYYYPVYVSREKEDALVKKFNYKIHNALHDALIMKKADKM
jgi:hypothetical protein